MKVTIAEASRLTGKSIPTLHRHTNTGKLSCSKNERDEKVVDTAELERVYGQLNQSDSETRETPDQDTTFLIDNQNLQHENDILKKENDNLKSQLIDAKEREKRLFDLSERLQKQNEVLMLPKPRRTLSDIINYFIPQRQNEQDINNPTE